jgi:hypothetical protein
MRSFRLHEENIMLRIVPPAGKASSTQHKIVSDAGDSCVVRDKEGHIMGAATG